MTDRQPGARQVRLLHSYADERGMDGADARDFAARGWVVIDPAKYGDWNPVRLTEAGQRLHDIYCDDPSHDETPVSATVETAWNVHAPTEETTRDEHHASLKKLYDSGPRIDWY